VLEPQEGIHDGRNDDAKEDGKIKRAGGFSIELRGHGGSKWREGVSI
jgi:hypothetical protein